MAKARAIIKRRKAVDNIRKITRTMELIATNRFRKALNRATEADAFTRKIAELVADLGETSSETSHPLLVRRDPVSRALLAGLDEQPRAGRRLQRQRAPRCPHPPPRQRDRRNRDLARSRRQAGHRLLPVPEDRAADATYTQFEDRPQFHEVEVLADKYIKLYVAGSIDRLDVAYTQFVSSSRQVAKVQTLLPISTADIGSAAPSGPAGKPGPERGGCRPEERSPSRTSSCPMPEASSRRSCRSRSRSGCSSASSTPP